MNSANRPPEKILVINFGQLGDIVLSLPILRAIRETFSSAEIALLVGKPGEVVIDMAGIADETISVDRVDLRDGQKFGSIWKILKLVKEVRRRKFDLVIDLHSLKETNILGFLSGAPLRLYAKRENRSLDFLSNFRPPPKDEDRNKHATERYWDVVTALGISKNNSTHLLKPRAESDRVIEKLLEKENVGREEDVVGLFVGAGHPSRRWPLARFAELAREVYEKTKIRSVVFVGPEEQNIYEEIRALFSGSAILLKDLSLYELTSALARISLLVSNDTGPAHIAAAVNTPVVLLLGRLIPNTFTPLGENNRILYSRTIAELTTEKVFAAVVNVLETTSTQKDTAEAKAEHSQTNATLTQTPTI
jgi:ADP-heptose:LPS heptosyltransferase